MVVTLDGYLKKRNAKTSVLMRNWNKRWFSLSGEHLTYSKNPRDKTPSGEFNMSECVSITKTEGNEQFEVVFPERTLLLRGDDIVDSARWMKALHQAQIAYNKGGRALPNGSPTSTLDVPPSRDNSSRGSDTARDMHREAPPQRGLGGDEQQGQESGNSTPSEGARGAARAPIARPSTESFGLLFDASMDGGAGAKSPDPNTEEETEVMAFSMDTDPSPPVHRSERVEAPPPAVREGFGKASGGMAMAAPPKHKSPDQLDDVVPAGAGAGSNDWLHDNWDSESDDGADPSAGRRAAATEDEVLSIGGGGSAPRGQPTSGPGSKSPSVGWQGQGSRDFGKESVEISAMAASMTDIRPVTPSVGPDTPTGPKRKAPKEEEPSPIIKGPMPAAAAGPQADADWLEEDWDSDEE